VEKLGKQEYQFPDTRMTGITMFIYLVGGPAVPKAGQLPIQPQNAYNLQGNPPLEAPLPLLPVVPLQ
jgi:hypothetical protein